ncbi:hypothetical protein HAX54_028005, partial [Datura stramonium]|nr:hypothetical protein [Datura stramonium]
NREVSGLFGNSRSISRTVKQRTTFQTNREIGSGWPLHWKACTNGSTDRCLVRRTVLLFVSLWQRVAQLQRLPDVEQKGTGPSSRRTSRRLGRQRPPILLSRKGQTIQQSVVQKDGPSTWTSKPRRVSSKSSTVQTTDRPSTRELLLPAIIKGILSRFLESLKGLIRKVSELVFQIPPSKIVAFELHEKLYFEDFVLSDICIVFITKAIADFKEFP